MCLIVIVVAQHLDLLYFNSPLLLEEFTDGETDVFVRFHSPQRLGLNNISLSVDLAVYPLWREALHGGGRHTSTTAAKHVMSPNRDGAGGCLLLWCDWSQLSL